MGDPLTLSNIYEYLDIAETHKFKVTITTSGYYLNNHKKIFHKSLKQLNISLNSFNKNALKCTFDEYMQGIFDKCDRREDENIFINLRLWNLDDDGSENIYNTLIFKKLEEHFKIQFPKDILINTPKSIRLAKKILLHFDSYFEWPSLKNTIKTDGFCHGLSSQIAILVDGRVVPCCLDCDGVMELGNINTTPLKEILNTQKVKNITESFKNKKAYEELCQKCRYKDRFNAVL